MAFDAATQAYRLTGVDLTRIEGIEGHTALKVLSEIGTDMSPWPTSKHFASWLGLTPNNRVSGGKRLAPRRLAPHANRAAAALRVAAQSLHRSHTASGAFLRRMKAKAGMPKAIEATAHKLAVYIYNCLKHGSDYVDRGQDYYEAQYRHRVLKHLARSAHDLGFRLVKEETSASAQLTPAL